MTTDELNEIATSLAKRYKRKCWWAPFTDMQQEALAAMLRAHQTYLEHPEGPERGYLWKAGVYAIKNMLLRESAPVSATSHTLDELKGITRTTVDSLLISAMRPVRTDNGAEISIYERAATNEDLPADDDLQDRHWLKRVRARVHAVLAPIPDSTLAREVLLGYLTPRETASEAGVPVRQVYTAVRRAKMAILNDRVLYDLTKERVK